jgi:hypothetical protein
MAPISFIWSTQQVNISINPPVIPIISLLPIHGQTSLKAMGD